MLAKIVAQDGREYYSPVFAFFDRGWSTAVIAFDREKNEFAYVKMYNSKQGISRCVFIVDWSEKGFVKDRTVKLSFLRRLRWGSGYDWLVENGKLCADIIAGKPVDDCYKEKALALFEDIHNGEWRVIENREDAENLLLMSGCFHDGVIDSFSYDRDGGLNVIVSGCWGAKISLRFAGDVKMQFSEEAFAMLVDATIFTEDGFVYWADDYSVKSAKDITEKMCYFRARLLQWKWETEYMDPEDD